jgi:hypothetical protein
MAVSVEARPGDCRTRPNAKAAEREPPPGPLTRRQRAAVSPRRGGAAEPARSPQWLPSLLFPTPMKETAQNCTPSDRGATHLQHARHDGALREVAVEELLVGRHLLHTHRALAWLELNNLVDQQERVAVRQNLLDAVNLEDGLRLRHGRAALMRRCARPRARRGRGLPQCRTSANALDHTAAPLHSAVASSALGSATAAGGEARSTPRDTEGCSCGTRPRAATAQTVSMADARSTRAAVSDPFWALVYFRLPSRRG